MYATSRKNENGFYFGLTNSFMRRFIKYLSESIALQCMKSVSYVHHIHILIYQNYLKDLLI